MAEYRITPRQGEPFTVRAESYTEAALHAARRLYGRKKGHVLRTTGDAGKSGYYAFYRPLPTGGSSLYGEPFHVS